MICWKCKAELPEALQAVFCPFCGVKVESGRQTHPKSRGNGTGSVYKKPNGTWVAEKTLGYYVDAAGKLHRKRVKKMGFRTKKEALAALPSIGPQTVEEKRRSVTFSALYDLWEPTHQKTKSTLNCYRAAYKHYAPVWAANFAEITIDDLQECVDSAAAGKRTRENMKALAGLLYKYAIPRHLAALNIAQYLTVTGETGQGKEGLPLEALAAIAAAVGRVPYADYVTAQCYLGFRPSELLALTVSDYDAARRVFVGGAKTDAGKNRTVPVSRKIQAIVDRLAGKPFGYVFSRPDGTQMPIEEYRRKFYAVLDACGIENPTYTANGVERRKYTPHSCRHTFATLIKSVQAPDKDKLELMGHTSTEMLRHYQDVDVDALRKIVDAI